MVHEAPSFGGVDHFDKVEDSVEFWRTTLSRDRYV